MVSFRGVHSFKTDADAHSATDRLRRWPQSMNFHRPKNSMTVSCSLHKSGDLPPESRLSRENELEMEMSDLNDRNVRRQFAQRSRELNANLCLTHQGCLLITASLNGL